ncbi:integrin beta-6 [Hyalella azteca]|uniref:Integrin beta n=1 Tax=Hyalella azteca TaxID=294128 RepID=A0A8B7N929_HYAAZ|nr:integrin beta-6 [Hyalella azteca]
MVTKRSSHGYRISFLVFCSLLLIDSSKSSSVCNKYETCNKCIEAPTCNWCLRDAVPKSACLGPDELHKCTDGKLQELKSGYRSDRKLIPANKYVRATLTPHSTSVDIRSGDTVEVPLILTMTSEPKVDLYYLMDISSSMRDDLESIKNLASTLGEKIKNHTSDFNVGFGTFVDKDTLPYIDAMVTIRGHHSPTNKHCNGSMGSMTFCNAMALQTSDTATFEAVVGDTHVLANDDSPEGGFDALLQALACKEQIRWRDEAAKILLYSTDAVFHYAGDGKLAGIAAPHDGACHMDREGKVYTEALTLDYPSVYQISRAANASEVHVVFAVVERAKALYDALSKQIELSSTVLIEDDSSNIVDLIIQEILGITTTYHMVATGYPEEDMEVTLTAECPKGSGSTCAGLELGDSGDITVSIKLKRCPPPDKPKETMLTIHPKNNAKINATITVNFLCTCQCEEPQASSARCSGRGTLECGTCACEGIFSGANCSCSMDSEQSNEMCITDSSGAVCSGRGSCVNGECLCDQFEESGSTHSYCSESLCSESDFSCGPTNDNLCYNHGDCRCGNCICHPTHTGEFCDCPTATERCDPSGSGDMCSGRGRCECNECVCDRKDGNFWFFGDTCQYCKDCGDFCTGEYSLMPCMQCEWFNKYKNFKVKETNKEQYCKSRKCQLVTKYNIVTREDINELKDKSSCKATDDTGKCEKEFWYVRLNEAEFYEVYYIHEDVWCTDDNIMFYIVVGALAGVLLLILIPTIIYCTRWRANVKEVEDFVRRGNASSTTNELNKIPVAEMELPLYEETASSEL